MTEELKLNPKAVGLELLAPNGSAICGTWEVLPGTAEAAAVDSDGDPEYQGSTDLIYDEQKTVCCAETGESLWIDEDGDLWRHSQLRAWVENAEESIPLYLPEDSARNGNDAEPFNGMQEINGQYLVGSSDYRALKARIAALEAGLRTIAEIEGGCPPGAEIDGHTARQMAAIARALLDGAPAAEAAPPTLYRWSVYAADKAVTLLNDNVTAATDDEAIAQVPGGATAERWMVNSYKCGCGNEWDDEWSCGCDDECPSCGADCSPTESTPLVVEG